ncbi:hypothetical protein HZA40_02000 [Candidatus Peregrinibacteria bacterium]|nr:hypothetical protein [Candidatus Peregrinibacteria bacterium]
MFWRRVTRVVAAVPEGATHRVLGGEFGDQCVVFLNLEHGLRGLKAIVRILDGKYNGRRIYVDPNSLAKVNCNGADSELLKLCKRVLEEKAKRYRGAAHKAKD